MFERSTEIHPRAASSVCTLRLLRAACIAVLLGATSPAPAQQPAPSLAAPAAPAQAAAVTPAVAPGIAPGAAAPAAQPVAAPAERCSGCHAQLTQRAIVHGALQKHDCQTCHRAAGGEQGKCRSRTAAHWTLLRTEPELCYGCHARKDQSKSVHTAVRQGSCLSCHEAHASSYAGLLNEPREKVCFACHEAEPLLTKPVKHAPVAEGRCLDCHDAHGGNLPNAIKAESGSAFCLKCHDAKAPSGKGTPGPAFRVDLSKPVVHVALKRTDCLSCHEGGHSGDNRKLLKKSVVDLCYGCHERKDRTKFPHSAVVVGDCAVCHDPHSSDRPKLLAKSTTQETCFICHQDDLTTRKVVHAPVAKGCEQCHDPHGGTARFGLKGGEGKAACYKCHKPLDEGKVKHAALERYGCTGCHDPHATANRGLLPKKVNEVCIACHPEQKDGRHVTPIAANGHPVGGDLNDPRRPGREFSCASCHNPHGSDNPRFFYFGSSAMDSCDGCHGDKTGKHPELKNVVSRARRAASAPATGVGGGAGAGGPGSGAGAPGAGSGGGILEVRP